MFDLRETTNANYQNRGSVIGSYKTVDEALNSLREKMANGKGRFKEIFFELEDEGFALIAFGNGLSMVSFSVERQ